MAVGLRRWLRTKTQAKQITPKAVGSSRRPFFVSEHRTTRICSAIRPADKRQENARIRTSGCESNRKARTMAVPLQLEELNEDWWADARCRVGDGSLAHIFFSDDLGDIARAKSICAECPVMLECLEGAVARREPWGVWGGQMFVSGKILATKRRRGRPPKMPRPEDELPEIPVPDHLQGYLRSA